MRSRVIIGCILLFVTLSGNGAPSPHAVSLLPPQVSAEAAPTWSALVRARLAERDYQGAARVLQNHISQHVKDYSVLNLLAATLERGGNLESAAVFYQKALDLRPQATTVRLNFAMNLVRRKQFTAAAMEFTRILKEDPVQAVRAPAYQQGPDDDAMRAFVAAVPARDRDWYELGMLFMRHGRVVSSQAVFEDAARLFPASAQLQYGLGWASQEGGRYDSAREALSRALELQPAYPEALLRLGYAYFVQGEYPEAVLTYERVLALQPATYEGHYFLALALAKRDPSNLEGAVDHLRQAITLNPRSFDSHLELGRIYLDMGKVTEARAELEMVNRLNPKLEKAHYLLAQVYTRSGQRPLADQELRAFEEFRRKDRLRGRETMNADLFWSKQGDVSDVAAKAADFIARYKTALLAGEYRLVWQWLTPESRRMYDDDPEQFARISRLVFGDPEIQERLRRSKFEGGKAVAGRIICEFAAEAGLKLPPLVLVEQGGEWKIDYAFEWTTAGLGYLGAR